MVLQEVDKRVECNGRANIGKSAFRTRKEQDEERYAKTREPQPSSCQTSEEANTIICCQQLSSP
jgi:hypothetical protein